VAGPSCAECHETRTLCNVPAARLAGQQAEHIGKQLATFATDMYAAPLRHGIVQNLREPQMRAMTDDHAPSA